MKPEIYSHKEGFNIILTRSPVNDPELEYRREAEKWVKKRQGEISHIGRTALNKSATKLKLSPEVTKRIEAEVLAPYEEHKANLKEYEEVLIEELERESPLSEVTREELKNFQQVLGLTDEDVARIEASILSEKEAEYLKQEEAERQQQQSQISAFSDEDTIYKKFCYRVGWSVEGEWITDGEMAFHQNSQHSQQGHFPKAHWKRTGVVGWLVGWRVGKGRLICLFSLLWRRDL